MGNGQSSTQEGDEEPYFPSWMETLPSQLHNIPLSQLAIPGTVEPQLSDSLLTSSLHYPNLS